MTILGPTEALLRYVKFETLNQLNRVQLAGPSAFPDRGYVVSLVALKIGDRGLFQSGRHQQMLARVHFSIPLSVRAGVFRNPYQSWDTQQIDRYHGRSPCHCLIPRDCSYGSMDIASSQYGRSADRFHPDLKMLDDCGGRPMIPAPCQL